MIKLLTNVLYGAVTVVVGGLAVLVAISVLPIPGGIEMKIVLSGSMEPAIGTGSVVIIQPRASYAVGDIVTFGADTKKSVPTTHRIISSRTAGDQTFFLTKGDANKTQDAGETDAKAVIGKVLFSIPLAGYVLDFSKKPLGFALMIAIPAALIVLYELLAIAEEAKRMMRGGKAEAPRAKARGVWPRFGSRREDDEPADPEEEGGLPSVLDLRFSQHGRTREVLKP